MGDWRLDRIGSARRGENPTVLARLPESFAVIGDVQWLPGYCVLLVDDPAVQRLSDLPVDRRMRYLDSLQRLAAAVEVACTEADSEFLRVNIEILGNTDPYLHAHVWPRYAWEPDHLKRKPVWLYPAGHWNDPAHALDARHDGLRQAITARLTSADGKPAPTGGAV